MPHSQASARRSVLLPPGDPTPWVGLVLGIVPARRISKARRTLTTLALTAAATVAAATLGGLAASSPVLAAAMQSAPVTPPRPMYLVAALHWEGRDLLAHNIEAVRQLRAEFPQVRFTHFVSPAYFTHPQADAAAARAAIRSAMRPGDTFGLSVGGWKSLVTKADVTFRSGPTFWGHKLAPVDCRDDCGQDVPLHLYTDAELDRIMTTGIRTLSEQGFGQTRGVAVQGWVASPQVLASAARSGMRYDFSGVAVEMVASRLYHYPLYQWVKSFWPKITPHTQPYVMTAAGQKLLEMPQALATADYFSANDVTAIFREYAEIAKRSAAAPTFTLGVAQETARMNLPQVLQAFASVINEAKAQGIALQAVDLPGMELKDAPAGAPSPAGSASGPVATTVQPGSPAAAPAAATDAAAH